MSFGAHCHDCVRGDEPARPDEQTAYEGFGPSFPIYANGGTGFSGPWTQGGFNLHQMVHLNCTLSSNTKPPLLLLGHLLRP
jgi:hypothetical protein